MKKNKFTASMLVVLLIFLTATAFPKNTKLASKDNLEVIKEKTFSISPNKNLYLQTDQGDISVNTWDESKVYVKILGNEKAKDKMTFDFSSSEDKIEIRAKKPHSFFNLFSSGIRLRFEIKVPKNFNVNLHTAGGNISVEDLTGENLLRTSGGNINLNHLAGNLDAKTSGGNFDINDITGKIKISTSGGNISAKNFNGDFDASTSGGNIDLKGTNSRIDAETSGGSVYAEYTGENKGIKLETSGGEVTLKVSKSISADVNLSTSGGSVNCDLTMSDIHKSSHSSLRGKVNGGGNEIRLESSGGNVSLEGY
jgi:DUF4097 and DUF4098 domain-containing protein YvlB